MELDSSRNGSETDALYTKISFLERYLNEARRNNFSLEHRIRNLTEAMGFRDLDQAEESQSLAQSQDAPPGPLVEAFNRQRVKALEDQLASQSAQISKLTSDLQVSQAEKRVLGDQLAKNTVQLQSALVQSALKDDKIVELEYAVASAKRTSHLSPHRENRASITLNHQQLQTNYNALLHDKQQLAHRFSEFIRKWKNFKSWFHQHYDRAPAGDITMTDATKLNDNLVETPPKKKRKLADKEGASEGIRAEVHARLDNLIEDATTALSQSQPFVEDPPSMISPKAAVTPIVIDSRSSTPEVIVERPRPTIPVPAELPAIITTPLASRTPASTPRQPLFATYRSSAAKLRSPTGGTSTETSESAKPRPRKSLLDRLSLRESKTPKVRSEIPIDERPPRVSSMSEPRRTKNPVAQDDEHDDKGEGTSRAEPLEKKKKSRIADTYPKKGRGRYAQMVMSQSSEDDVFEINPAQNGGLKHAYDAVVRNKEQRQKMHGVDCPCCRDYYDAVGPLPPRLAPPLWKSPSPSIESPSTSKSKSKGRQQDVSPEAPDLSRETSNRDHQQRISRHRHDWAPPTTPPDYWTIGFPNTQQVEEINERAKQMKVDKKRRIAEEAKKPDGKYQKRSGK